MKLNGNLVLNDQGNSEVKNFVVERLPKASEPAVQASEKGRMYFDTTNNVYNFNDGTAWVQFATGGNATSLQNEVDAIEASLGTFVGSDGAFNGAALDTLGNVAASTSLLDALTQLDAAVSTAAGVDTLGELTDVTLTSPAAGSVLRFTGTGDNSVDATLVLADMSDVVGTGTIGQVMYHDGSTFVMAVPGATSGVQAHDDTLDDVAALGIVADDEFMVGTGAGTFAYESGATARTSMGAQTQGDVLDDMNILGAVVNDGDIIVGTGAGTFAYEGGATARASLGLTIGTDVQAFDAELDALALLGAVSDNEFIVGSGAGAFTYESESTVRTTLGLVSGGVGDIWVEKSGDTMSGVLNMGTNKITSLAEPTAADDGATKNYVDSIASGLDVKESVKLATTGVLPAYTQSGSGVGAILTADAVGILTVDSVATVLGDRILVQSEAASHADHGIYEVTTEGTAGVAFILTRATDVDGTPANEVTAGMFTFVEEGSVNADFGFVLVTNDPITLDTTALQFSQFTGAGSISAGVGLGQTGNVIDVNLGAGIAELPSDEVGIHLFDAATGALILTPDGSARGTLTGDSLYLLLDSSTLSQGSSGLKVASGGVTELEINTSAIGDGLDGGSGTVLSVDLKAGSGLTIDTGEISLASVPNSALANSSVTLAADTGTSETLSLGQTMTIAGGTGISTVVSASDTVTVNIDATTGQLNDVTLTAIATDDILQWNGTAFVNVTAATLVGDAAIDDLSDVTGVGSSVDGEVLMWNNVSNTVQAEPMYFLYTSGAASTSHTVTHSLDCKFASVTVVDSTDDVIIPQSITFDSTSQLTVTFNTSIDCKVVVMGVKQTFA